MRKLIVLTALVALLAVPSFATGHGKGAKHGVHKAVAACKSERSADPAAFQAKYANKNGKRALRRCVVRHVKQARQTCRSERGSDPAAFKAKYANKNGKHAARRCVRQHLADPVS